MTLQIIFIYCLCDELLKATKHVDDPQTKMSDAEIMTFAITSVLFFQGNYAKTRLFFASHRYFGYLLGKSRLNKRLLRISHDTWIHILAICRSFLSNDLCKEYIVDSFPVPVCHNSRLTRCKILQGKKYHGYCASKQSYFFGIKVHVLTTVHGFPVEISFTPGSVADIKAFREMNLNLAEGSIIYADRAYTDYCYEDILSNVGITLCAHRKRNAKRQHSYQSSAKQKYHRKRIETTFSLIAKNMPRWIHAVTFCGFMLKVLLFVIIYPLSNMIA